MSAEPLAGRVALVAGGAQGIGHAVAGALVALGAAVVIADPGTGPDGIGADPALTRRTAAALGATAFADSIASPSAAAAAVALAVTRFGRLDILVNAAAIRRDAALPALDAGDVEAVIRANLLAAVCTVGAASPALCARPGGGRIVNIAATARGPGTADQAADAAARAGLLAFTRAIASDLAGTAVTCNAIVPEAEDEAPALPARVAALAAGLCLPAAQAVSGQVLGVGGDAVSLLSPPQRVSRIAPAAADWSPAPLAALLAALGPPPEAALQ